MPEVKKSPKSGRPPKASVKRSKSAVQKPPKSAAKKTAATTKQLRQTPIAPPQTVTPTSQSKRLQNIARYYLGHGKRFAMIWWRRSVWNRVACIIIAAFFLFVTCMYAVAVWYQHSLASQPYSYGVTFIPEYSRKLGLNPRLTMQAMIDDLGVRQFRLVSYWDKIEPEKGTYDFDELDWQFQKANDAHAKVSLAIGLRQPRWPECHMPSWQIGKPMSEWSTNLNLFIQQVIERYRNNPALESYQLENEFFMSVFGDCPDFSRDRLVNEFNLVKQLDSTHPVIISRSNNWIGVPVREPLPDKVGISVYKRVWESTFTKRYAEYPLPPWFYASLGGVGKILTGRDLMIHELQAEAWLPDGYSMDSVADVPEQNKSLNSKRLADRFDYAHDTGLRETYVWGAEWWYWRKTVANDPSLWDTAKLKFYEINQ